MGARELRNERIKATKEVIAKSVVGDYRAEHLFTLRQSPAAYRRYQKPNRRLRSRDSPILGAPRATRLPKPTQPTVCRKCLRSELKRSSASISPESLVSTSASPELCLERLVPIFTKFRSASAFAS
jgi:hypothetical protein